MRLGVHLSLGQLILILFSETKMKRVSLHLGLVAACTIGLSAINIERVFAGTLSETRNELELFTVEGQPPPIDDVLPKFPKNIFSFELPDLVSNDLAVGFSWTALDTDNIHESFDVEFIDQQGNALIIFDNVFMNSDEGTANNRSGSYSKTLSLSSLSKGTVSFHVSGDGLYGIHQYGNDGQMTLALGFENDVKAIPTPVLLPGLFATGIAVLRKSRKSSLEKN